MKKTEITIGENLTLAVELEGLIENNELLFGGLLREILPIKTKYWLSRLNDKVQSYKSTFNSQREELIKALGEEKDGAFNIAPLSDGEKPNPKYQEFITELNSLVDEKIELEHSEFTIEMFSDLKTGSNYPVFFKFLSDLD